MVWSQYNDILSYATMNKESACIMVCIVSANFAKTLDLKCEFDVTLWRHKQRTPINYDHHNATGIDISKCRGQAYDSAANVWVYPMEIFLFLRNR